MTTVIQLNDLHAGLRAWMGSNRPLPPPTLSSLRMTIASPFIPAITRPDINLIPTVGQNRISGKLIKEDSQLSPPSPSQLDTLRASTGQLLAAPPTIVKHKCGVRQSWDRFWTICQPIFPTSHLRPGSSRHSRFMQPSKHSPRGRPHRYAGFLRKLDKGWD